MQETIDDQIAKLEKIHMRLDELFEQTQSNYVYNASMAAQMAIDALRGQPTLQLD